MPAQIAFPPALRKIAPLRLPQRLIDAVQVTADAMRTAMCPRVSWSWGARELITRGCADLEAQLERGQMLVWSVAEPPRGHRRRRGERAPATTFVLVAPMSLPESLLERLDRIRRRHETLSGTRVSLARLLRETIALGYEVRERERARRAEDADLHAEILRRAGVLDPSQLVSASVSVVSPYVPPGPRTRWADTVRSTAKRTAPRPKTPKMTSVRSAPHARARAPRKKATRRTDRTEGSDDGSDAPPHSGEREHPTSGSAVPPRPLTDADRRFLDYLIDLALHP